MEHAFQGINFQLRSVAVEDSDAVLRLRLNSSLNAFLHETTTEGHQSWILEQIERKDDFYFAIEEIFPRRIHGFVGLYDLKEGTGEWGRWILNPNSVAAIESYWLILKFGFSQGLTSIYCRTDYRNHKVMSIHNRLPYSNVKLYRDEKSSLDYMTHTLELSDWPNFEFQLHKYIRRRIH